MAGTLINTLRNPDGSATHTALGYTVIASVNGPIEVSRRDELPEEATLEVNLSTATGAASPRDRYLESLIHSTLKRVILTRELPRTLIQLTLQILNTPKSGPSPLPASLMYSVLPILPGLLTTSLLALLASNIPLSTTITPILALNCEATSSSGAQVFIVPKDGVGVMTSVTSGRQVTGIHLFAFARRAGKIETLLALSEGDSSIEEIDEVTRIAEESLTGTEVNEMNVDGDKERIGDEVFLLESLRT